jgi:uncharacterized peroxidase-related enzyme
MNFGKRAHKGSFFFFTLLNYKIKMTKIFNVPTIDQVSEANQGIFENLKKALSFVPNLYATFAHSDTALGTYLNLQNAKSSLSAKEREVINLVVSQVNECKYCLSAHTVLGKMVGFTDEQVLEIRHGKASFDSKLDALAKLVKDVVIQRGHADQVYIDSFFAAGWTDANLVDVLMVVGDKIISNFLHGVTKIPVDFPLAPEL